MEKRIRLEIVVSDRFVVGFEMNNDEGVSDAEVIGALDIVKHTVLHNMACESSRTVRVDGKAGEV